MLGRDAPPKGLSQRFGRMLMSRLLASEDVHAEARRLSYLEIVFWLLLDPSVEFPVFDGVTTSCQRLDQRLVRATLTELSATVRNHLRWLFQSFDLGHHMVRGLDRSSLGVHIPQEGIWAVIPPEDLQRSHEGIRQFTSNRPLRRACDLARPP